MVRKLGFPCGWILLLVASGCGTLGNSHASKPVWKSIGPASMKQFASSIPKPKLPTASHKLKDPANLHLKYAQWREEVGDLSQARSSYQTVLGEDPRSVDAIVGLARLDALAGRTAEAEQGFARALRLQPNNPHALAAAGQFHADRGQWDRSLELLHAAMLAAPDEPMYRYHLAVAMARSGDIEGSLPHFSRTIGVAAAHYNIGHILHEQGQIARAETHLAQAVAQNPNLAEARTLLNEIRRSQQQHPPAQQQQMLAQGQVTAPPIQRTAAQQDTGRATWANHAQPAAPTGTAAPQHQTAFHTTAAAPQPESQTPPQWQPAGTSSGAAADNPFAQPEATAIPQPPAGLSPQQLEQWRNQFAASR